jgi:hypothetical protein
MMDKIRNSWLERQFVEGMALAASSDVLGLVPVSGSPPDRYVARLDCCGLVMTDAGVAVATQHLIGICFPESYLRTPCNPGLVLSWLEPQSIFHPNIRAPFICAGNIPVGMSLVNLIHQVFAIVTYQNFTPREDDALNKEACAWARRNLDRFPVDPRRSISTGARQSSRDLHSRDLPNKESLDG